MIAKALGVEAAEPCYVHGCAAHGNVAIGAADYADLRPSAKYMYKSFSRNYRPTDLIEALDAADEVYIFGQSLGKVDSPYFEDFFEGVASGGYGSDKKYIRIFTYDDDSRQEVLENLRKMCGGVVKLMGNADFDIICTKDGMDREKVREVMEHINN